MSNTSTSSLANLAHTVITRIVAVFHEVLAFFANIFHVLKGDIVTHVITPAESLLTKAAVYIDGPPTTAAVPVAAPVVPPVVPPTTP